MKSVLKTKFNNTIEQANTKRFFFIHHVHFLISYHAKIERKSSSFSPYEKTSTHA